MRVSVDKEDKGFTRNAPFLTIKLDGVEQKNCITADDELGEIVRYKSKDGELVVNRIDRLICKERLNGKVEIISNLDEV